MENNQLSNFNLLRGKASFTNEPLWYRLVVYVIQAVFILSLVYLAKELLLPFLAKNILQEVAGKLANLGKGRSP
jgi:hypothetical protein